MGSTLARSCATCPHRRQEPQATYLLHSSCIYVCPLQPVEHVALVPTKQSFIWQQLTGKSLDGGVDGKDDIRV